MVLSISCLKAEVTLDASSISYNLETEVVTACGDVTVDYQDLTYGHKILRAPCVEYNKKSGTIRLIGQATIEDELGNLIETNDVFLDDEFRKATVNAFKLIMKDKSWVEAEKVLKDSHIYSMDKARYSPCIETKCKTALWDLTAKEVVYDTKKKTFEYKDVTLRIKGVSVLYSPYFTHPSFEVKRKTGFLTPTLSTVRDNGTIFGFPFFWAISKDKDLTIKPFAMFQRRFMGAVEYRQAFKNADLAIEASYLSKSPKSLKKVGDVEKRNRWHGKLLFKTRDLENKRLIVDVVQTSDPTYLIKYPVNNSFSGTLIKRKVAESKVVVDSFDNDYYFSLASHWFKNDSESEDPKVIPEISFDYQKEALAGFINLESKSCVFSKRDNSKDNYGNAARFANTLSYYKDFRINNVIVDINTGAKATSYYINANENNKTLSKTFINLQNSVSIFYPFAADISKTKNIIFGPKVSLISVSGSDRTALQGFNEDSVFSKENDLNTFNFNRYGGTDRVERGEKIVAGIDGSVYTKERRSLNFFLGQAEQLSDKSGSIGNHAVGRVVFKPKDNISLRSTFVGFAPFDMIRMFDLGSSFKIKNTELTAEYIYDGSRNVFRSKDVSQLGLKVGYDLTQNWTLIASQLFNLSSGPSNLNNGLFAKYEDECFKMTLGVYSSRYKDKDIKPSTGIFISIIFKTIGGISQSLEKYTYKRAISHIE